MSFCLVNQMEIVNVIYIKYCNGICWVNTKTVNTKSSVKIYEIELSFWVMHKGKQPVVCCMPAVGKLT